MPRSGGKVGLPTYGSTYYLVDPARRIELDDLVSREVQRVTTMLKEAARFTSPASGTTEELVTSLIDAANELVDAVKPFCASLQVAARWGTPDQLTPWADGIRSFVAAANRLGGGSALLLDLRQLPGVLSMMTAGVACVSSGRLDNLKVLVVDPTVRDRHESVVALPVLDATDPYAPFRNGEWVDHYAKATIGGLSVVEAIAARTRYRTPAAELMHNLLRDIFADQMPDSETYDAEYDKAEVTLGLLAQDAAIQLAQPGREPYARSYWYGRSTWRAATHNGKALDDLASELARHRPQWGMLRAGMFGGDATRAEAALTRYAETFAEMKRRF